MYGRPSLKQRQKDAVTTMLALHGAAESADVAWKVLIYDKQGRDILAPLLSVAELREAGVTLHLMISADRQAIQDVAAVYFVEPTEENIRRIGQDVTARLYDRFYLCFTSFIPRPLLESLAAKVIEAEGGASLIASVFDEYLNYQSLEDRLFSLSLPDAYRLFNDPASTEAQIGDYVDKIAQTLYSVFVTTGEVPVIRCARGNAAASIAERLDRQFRGHLNNAKSSSLFDESLQSATQRPVLILLDRSIDLSSMLTHSWMYEALLADILKMRLNKVTVDVEGKTKQIDVNPSDYFFRSHAHSPVVPDVSEAAQGEMNRIREDTKRVTSVSESLSPLDDGGASQTESLRAAVNLLPEIKERERVMDIHMRCCKALLDAVGARKLDKLIAAQENVSANSKNEIIKLIREVGTGTNEDKARMALVYTITMGEAMTEQEFAELSEALKAVGASTRALGYIKQTWQRAKMFAGSNPSSSSASSRTTEILSAGLGRLGLSDALVGGAVQMLKTSMTAIKSSLLSAASHPATRIVDAVLENKAEAEALLYFDPKVARERLAPPKAKVTYSECIVVAIGGGNYHEFASLQKYARETAASSSSSTAASSSSSSSALAAPSPNTLSGPSAVAGGGPGAALGQPGIAITYGATDMVSPIDFLHQLEALGAAE